MTTPFSRRHELLFLYEAVDCNPNGDPLDENRPRIDPVTGVCTVTDVRIKRTVRDEILSWEPDVSARLESGLEILIRDTHQDDGSLSTGAERALTFGTIKKKPTPAEVQAIRDAVLRGCIDARLFGSTLPIGSSKGGGASLKLTGPVQLSAFSRSLHRVSPQFVQMTAAFAGSKGASAKSFAERHLLPYALIGAYGVANPAAARATGASEQDLEVLLRALWSGTANLATTSKMGHAPLLLLDVELEAGTIGRLDRRVRLDSAVDDEAIRSTDDFRLELKPLLQALTDAKPRRLRVRQDPRLRTCREGVEVTLQDALQSADLTVELLG